MFHQSSSLFKAFRIGETLSVTNRFAVAPMTRVSACQNGSSNERMERYYRRFGEGGFGLVITEGLYTDQEHSQGYLYQPGLSDDEQAATFRPLTQGLKAQGTASFAQIMHAGALSQGNRFRQETLGPSAVVPRGEQMAFYRGRGSYAMPEAMSDEQIERAIRGFAESALRAKEIAGFDGVEIHGANGYLLDQFLTPHTNLRADRWGGTLEHRMRLLLRVVQGVRSEVGTSYPVGIRISQGKVNDFHHKWRGGEKDAEVIFGLLRDAGVDFLHLTEYRAWEPAFEVGGSTLVQLARKYAPEVPIIANGGLDDLDKAQRLLEKDGADIVAIGKGALANPDLPARVAAGQILRPFDSEVLRPIADVKDWELQPSSAPVR